VRFDDDGVVRRMAPFEANGPSLSPDLMTVVHRATRRRTPPTRRGRRPDPADPVRRPAVDRYRQVSFSSVLAGEVPPS
jgi:hypothetical protein